MELITCLYCKGKTTAHRINVQKKVNTRVITIKNAPVYFCKPCNETFLAKETLSVMAYIRDKGLDAKLLLFDFDELVGKISK
jgi:YgiT-type zinc finger domain-containing protein